MQVLPLLDFFRCFIKVRGFSSSRDFTHFYCGAPAKGESLEDIDIIQKLPPSCIISTPVDPSVLMKIETKGEPANNSAPERGKDVALMFQPEYIQLGKKVLEELLHVHPSYKYLLFYLLWASMQQRSKELANLALPVKKVLLEFFKNVSEGDNRVMMNEAKRQWDVLKPVMNT